MKYEVEVIDYASHPEFDAYANSDVDPRFRYTHGVYCEGPEDEDLARKCGIFVAIRKAVAASGLESSTWNIYRKGEGWIMADCWKK